MPAKNIFSVRSSSICQYSNKLEFDPVLIWPKLASVLIRAYLWEAELFGHKFFWVRLQSWSKK